MPLDLPIDYDELAAICRRYRVAKLELFGSRARCEARSDSDVDLLVTFEKGYTLGLEFVAFCQEFEVALGRHAEVVTQWMLDHDPARDFQQQVRADAEALYAD